MSPMAEDFAVLGVRTLGDAEARMARILEKNQHWRECADGSYEMALMLDGYWVLEAIAIEMRRATGAAQEGPGYTSTDPIPTDATEGHGEASPGYQEP
jgi:hypothetical protein